MNITHALMCPHCAMINTQDEEPKEESLITCSACGNVFKVISIFGRMMTANAGDDPEEVRKSFEPESITKTIFDELLNSIKQGQRAGGIIHQSNPERDNWVQGVIDKIARGNWRRDLPETVLLACPCPGCREERERRNAEKEEQAAQAEQSAANNVDKEIRDQIAAFQAENRSVPNLMRNGADTYEERNKLYGDAYKNFGNIMKAMFPNGFAAVTVEDWNRLGVLNMIVSKLARYATNMEHSGGHVDSAHDMGVYAFMLEELTRKDRGEQ